MSGFDNSQDKYVTFKSGNEYFGLKIQYVDEIIMYQEVTQVPERADYIKGLINLRGRIIPVIDVRTRFKQEELPYNDRTCIIVITVKDTVVGLIVEKIAEVVEIPEEEVMEAPLLGSEEKAQNRYIYGVGQVGDSVKLLLDPERLIKDEDWVAIDQIIENAEEE